MELDEQLRNCMEQSFSVLILIQYYPENLVVPEIEPGTSGSVARNSDH
jgi:hypothetical protein